MKENCKFITFVITEINYDGLALALGAIMLSNIFESGGRLSYEF